MILFTGAVKHRDMAGGLLLLCVILGATFARLDTLLPRLPIVCGLVSFARPAPVLGLSNRRGAELEGLGGSRGGGRQGMEPAEKAG